MTTIFRAFLCDAYNDRPSSPRAKLEERVRQLKCAAWADPGDTELRTEIAAAEAALRAFDQRRSGAS